MRLLISLLIFIPILTWLITFKKNKDLLLPKNIYTFLYFVKISLPTFLLGNINNINLITNINLRNAILKNSCYFEFVILELFSYYLVLFGMNIVFKRKTNTREDELKNIDKKYYRIFGVILYVIGLLSAIIIINKIGGLNYFINNLQQRTILLRDMDFLSWLLPFLSYGCILISYSSKKKNISIGLILFAAITGLIQGFGGRTTMLFLILEVIFIFHYSVNRIDFKSIFRLKNGLIAIILFLSFVTISSFRTTGATEKFFNNPLEYLTSQNNSINSILVKESYVSHYIFTIDYFKEHELWYGASFKGLLYAIVPSSIYPAKPPVDDGTYLYSISLGRTDVKPLMSFKSLNLSSYPLETFGSMYANFGIIGIFIGMILLGYIIGYTYRNMSYKKYSLYSVIIYVTILFGFELSTLRIFQTLETIIIFGIIYYIVRHIRFKNI